MHHLFLSGIAARDASVTDYTTADDTLTPAPPTPHVPTPPAVPPASHPLVTVPDLDFYLLEGERIAYNWCLIDVLAVFAQAHYHAATSR